MRESSGFGFNGEIEVILEDKFGNVKAREVKKNTITDAYYKILLYNAFDNSAIQNVLKCATRAGYSFLYRQYPSTLGLYALNTPIEIKPETIIPPYVDDVRIGLHPNVVFYNVGGVNSETPTQLKPEESRCYFDQDNKDLVTEYTKTSGSGTIRSVCIGRAHTIKSGQFRAAISDYEMAGEFSTGVAQHLIEHTQDGSIIHGSTATTGNQFNGNVKTKSYNFVTGNSVLHNNIVGQFGGQAVTDQYGRLCTYKVSRLSFTDTTVTDRVTYVKNFKSASVVGTIDVTFTARAGILASSSYYPVLVARPSDGIIEILHTVSAGMVPEIANASIKHPGANLQKAVLDVADIDNISISEVIDLGIIPYTVSGWSDAGINYYMSGLLHDEKYYLPYAGFIDNAGVETIIADTGYQEGIVAKEDFTEYYEPILFRVGTEVMAYVVGKSNNVRTVVINGATCAFVYQSQVLSGISLASPITKNADDILRVIYRYKVSDAFDVNP